MSLLLTLASNAAGKTTLKKSMPQPADQTSAFAELELRPSWTPSESRLYSYNYGELGVRFNPNLYLGYQQNFVTELSQDPNDPKQAFRLDNGFLRAKIDNVWVEPESKSLSLSFEPRLYLPTPPSKADAGMVMTILPYLKLTQKISDDCSFTMKEGPSLPLYTRDGTYTPATRDKPESSSVNANFENFFWLQFDYAPAKKPISLSVPLLLISTHYRDFDPSADNNASWSYFLELYPELTFTLDRHLYLGVAYETGNLINLQNVEEDSGPVVGSGTFHVFLRTSFNRPD
jgi:hypothetical protein